MATVSGGANDSEPTRSEQAAAEPDPAPEAARISDGGAGQSPKVRASESPPAAPTADSALWPNRALAVAAGFLEWLSRPRVRLAVIGAILLLTGGVFMTNSVWTLPLVVVGALMVAIAWVGRRLDGRFAVQWGEAGTQLEFRAKIKAPQLATYSMARRSSSDTLGARVHSESEGAATIDGEAHTVEIEVSELEALIAAVQTTDRQAQETDASVPTAPDFRVARGGVGGR